MIQKGLPFYFTNPDPTYPTPEGNIPGAGTVSGCPRNSFRRESQIGWETPAFSCSNWACSVCTQHREETLVVGDRLDTDIQGGQESGCKTAMVLTGISTREDAAQWQPQPDLGHSRYRHGIVPGSLIKF